jgi:uncharacterized protein YndB with AHSA1/START domain
MTAQSTRENRATVPDVRKDVIVDLPLERAFSVFVNHPLEWWPPTHKLVPGQRVEIVFEPRLGGRFWERDADGTVCDWGRILRWNPPHQVAMTWRIDGRWRMITDDERASEIEVEFTPLDDGRTQVSLAHVRLWKHGPDATAIHAALDGPSPGETLARYASVAAARSRWTD